MTELNLEDLKKYVNNNISKFHTSKIEALKKLKLKTLLKRKNPYLFKAKDILIAQDLIKTILDAYLSSQEETLFGDFLEDLAIFICSKIFNGFKSSSEGIDLEFEKDSIRYLISIKSGPNWGNSQQILRMKDNFNRAIRVIKQNNPSKNIIAVNGCCYGKDNNPNKGTYFKYCGQEFWTLISGSKDLYIEIIDPLGHRAKERNEEFQKEYSKVINNFTLIFSKQFVKKGLIDWDKLVKFNSGKTE